MTHPPKPHHHHHHHHHHKHVHDASPPSPDAVVSNLWDEFWFFQNCLTDGTPKLRLSTSNPTTTPPQPPVPAPLQVSSPAGTVAASLTIPHHRDATTTSLIRHQSISLPTAACPAPPASAPPRRMLMKAPSMPPDIADYQKHRHDHHGDGDDDDDANQLPVRDPHKNKMLQRSYSSMQHYSSPFSSSYKAYLTPSTSHRPPRDFTLQAHWIAPNKATYRHHHHHYNSIPTAVAASTTQKLTLHVKKWKSLTDLEHQEVQGFKDLGFVFDAGAGANISPVLLDIIPGLRSEATSPNATDAGTNHDLVVTRPYLSEAWLMHRSAPPMLTWDGRGLGSGSPAIMKEKIRFWARAVASNVRQEC